MSENNKCPAQRAVVLIADDEQGIRLVLRSMLRDWGFENIIEASNGRVAMQAINSKKFDLILCDWQMPEKNGMEILDACRKSELNKQAIFMMCTGTTDSELVKQAIAKGVSNYISKPFNQNTIGHKLGRHFQLQEEE